MIKNSFLSLFLLVTIISPVFASKSACLNNCKRNYSTSPTESARCEQECEGTAEVLPVVTSGANADAPTRDGDNPQNDGSRNR